MVTPTSRILRQPVFAARSGTLTTSSGASTKPSPMSSAWLTLVPVTDSPPSPNSSSSSSSGGGGGQGVTCRLSSTLSSSSSSSSSSSCAPYLAPSASITTIRPLLERIHRRRPRWPTLPVLPPPTPTPTPTLPTASSSSLLAAQYECRPMQPCDLEAVQALHVDTLPVTYQSSYFISMLNDPSYRCLVATLPRSPGSSSSPSSSPSSSLPDTSPRSLVPKTTSSLSGKPRICRDIVGCVSARRVVDSEGGGLRILTLCVSKSKRNTGMASLLLQTAIDSFNHPQPHRHHSSPSFSLSVSSLNNNSQHDHNRPLRPLVRVTLHVQSPNAIAHRFYESKGFKTICLKPGYYAGLRMRSLDPNLRLLPPPSTHSISISTTATTATTPSSGGGGRDVDAWFMEAYL